MPLEHLVRLRSRANTPWTRARHRVPRINCFFFSAASSCAAPLAFHAGYSPIVENRWPLAGLGRAERGLGDGPLTDVFAAKVPFPREAWRRIFIHCLPFLCPRKHAPRGIWPSSQRLERSRVPDFAPFGGHAPPGERGLTYVPLDADWKGSSLNQTTNAGVCLGEKANICVKDCNAELPKMPRKQHHDKVRHQADSRVIYV
jgi:hypothetical protein